MPTTVNGVGTHYYGKKHRHDRTATCHSCGRVATLSSFETRLWFVVLFIPVIPLGRKRITDQCSICSRHYVVPVKQWEAARQSQTSAAMEQFRQAPSEESALVVHGTLMAFQQYEEAVEFRRRMLERYPDAALLPAGLALHLENNGLASEALPLWERAYELDAELPEARIGLGRQRMFEGRLEEARALLKFLEEPGAEQQYNLEPLFHLSSVLQQKEQHREALEIVEVLMKALPSLANDRKFRKFVQKSEKAVKKQESVLPGLSHSPGKLFTSQYSSGQRWFVGLAIAAVLAAIGLAINNEYIRRHRSLTILNATGDTVNVKVDDQPPVTVTDKFYIPVAEGTHNITVTGAVDEQYTIDVSSGYWARWSSTPVWIVNVGGEGVIFDVSVHYAVHPQPPNVRIVSDPIFVKDHVDYPFEEAPDSIDIGSENSVVTKTVLSWMNPTTSPGGALAGYLTVKSQNPQQAWEFAKRKLRRNPDDDQLLGYTANDVQSNQRPEFRQLLESNLKHRPVSINWHRIYQDLPEVSAEYASLVARYDLMLAEEPQNAALLYLRGRIDSVDDEQRRYQKLAAEADPMFPWPDFALGYDAMCAGEWEQALTLLQRAHDKGFPANQLLGRRTLLLMALGRFEEAETLLRADLQSNPSNLSTAILMAEVLIRQDREFEADEALKNAVASFNAEANGSFAERIHQTNSLRHYFKGELTEAVQEASRSLDSELTILRIMMLMEQGDMAEATRLLPPVEDAEDRILPVLCSLGYFAIGDNHNAEDWYQKAIQQYESMGLRFMSLTQFLKSTPTLNSVQELQRQIADPSEKAALLTLLGTRTNSPEIRNALYSGARQMMIQLMPPRGLLENVHALETSQP